MTNKATILLLAFLLVGALTRVAAEDTLSLSQARTLALAQSKTLQQALASVDAAKLDEKVQSYTLLPSIAASASGNASLPASSLSTALSGSAGLSIRQTLFDGTYSVLAAIDKLSTSIAQATAREEYFNVLNEADTAYYSAARAQASVDAAQSDLDGAKANEVVAQANYEGGTLSQVDLMKQQATLASSQAALVSAQGSLSVAMRTLASLTGVTLPVTLETLDTASTDSLMQRIATLSDAQATAFVENLAASAAKNNPSVLAANLSVEKAQKNVDLAKAGYLPSVSMSLAGSVDVSGTLRSSASLQVSIPLDLWNTAATVASRQIAAKQASLALSETQRTSDVAIEQAVYDTISSAKSAAASQQALAYAQRYQESIQEQYKLSTASSADLSDAAQLVSEDRASLISAQYQFLADLASLRALAGIEEDDLLLKLIP